MLGFSKFEHPKINEQTNEEKLKRKKKPSNPSFPEAAFKKERTFKEYSRLKWHLIATLT